jgi:hypothetical protein
MRLAEKLDWKGLKYTSDIKFYAIGWVISNRLRKSYHLSIMRRLSYVTHFVHKTFKTNLISEVLLVERNLKVLKTEAFQHVPVGRDRSVMSGA